VIKAQTQMTLESFKPAIKYVMKNQGFLTRVIPLVSILLILFSLFPLIDSPGNFNIREHWIAALGIVFAFMPLWIRQVLINNFKHYPTYQQTINWNFARSKLQAQGPDISLEREWKDIDEIHVTPVGFLMYVHKKIFYWIPKSSFKSEKDFETVLKYIIAKGEYITFDKEVLPLVKRIRPNLELS